MVFSSASGGAGTSVFAAMVAWRLAQRKLQCALVDCDFAAGGIDVLLGIENEPGLRFQTVDIPLGKTEGAALNGELPQWERVGVLASQPWNGSDPEPWTVSAVLEALAQANDVVVVDIGAPSALHSLPMLRQCRQVVLAELTVLGLARARAARAMMIRQGESRPIMVGVVPRGLSRRGGVVDAHEASEYLHEELAGVVAPDRGLHGDVLEGLGIGADDFLSKPFRVAELRARVAAHLRRQSRTPAHRMVRSGVAFDLTARSAAVEGAVLPLTRSEYAICEYLALHAGQTFTKEQIYEAVFGIDGTADDTAVTQHIKNIRAKLRAAGVPEPEKLLNTVWGVGYRWKSED